MNPTDNLPPGATPDSTDPPFRCELCGKPADETYLNDHGGRCPHCNNDPMPIGTE